jgi:hypothetical protein
MDLLNSILPIWAKHCEFGAARQARQLLRSRAERLGFARDDVAQLADVQAERRVVATLVPSRAEVPAPAGRHTALAPASKRP